MIRQLVWHSTCTHETTASAHSLLVSAANARGICNQVILNKCKIATGRCSYDVGFACYAGSSSFGSLPSHVSALQRNRKGGWVRCEV